MYAAAANPISEELLRAMAQPVQPVQPTVMPVQMPQLPPAQVSFQGQQGGGSFNGVGQAIGKAVGGQEQQAGGLGNMMTNWSEGAQAGWQKFKDFAAPTHSIAPPSPNAPMMAPSAAAHGMPNLGIGTPNPGLQGLGGMAGGSGPTGAVAAAAPAAGSAGMASMLPGAGLGVLGGKMVGGSNKGAMLGALGGLGLALAIPTGGLSLALPAIGGIAGGLMTRGKK